MEKKVRVVGILWIWTPKEWMKAIHQITMAKKRRMRRMGWRRCRFNLIMLMLF
jgi:uncharacterized protein YjeT (DUF2065 family)